MKNHNKKNVQAFMVRETCSQSIEIVVNSRRRMHLCMQDDQNGQKMMVLTSAEETRLTCFILLQNIFF